MSDKTSTWTGKHVRHLDGRQGVIRGDFPGFLHRLLRIQVHGGTEQRAYVQLNSNGPDTGEPGWYWWCEGFAGGPAWLALHGEDPVPRQPDWPPPSAWSVPEESPAPRSSLPSP